ncbi:MAG TPA: hypothetical protein VE465_02175 [Streptosporangiaceae bacterium]|jgi:hypothetical protein|nr:hypothetical protein [Streptosporangiaceae bacterium]
MSVIHIAGPDITVGHHLRQRCAWCGATLIDDDLTRLAVPAGQDPRPATWTVGALVEVDGDNPRASWVVEHVDGDPLPDNACGALDPAATR